MIKKILENNIINEKETEEQQGMVGIVKDFQSDYEQTDKEIIKLLEYMIRYMKNKN